MRWVPVLALLGQHEADPADLGDLEPLGIKVGAPSRLCTRRLPTECRHSQVRLHVEGQEVSTERHPIEREGDSRASETKLEPPELPNFAPTAAAWAEANPIAVSRRRRARGRLLLSAAAGGSQATPWCGALIMQALHPPRTTRSLGRCWSGLATDGGCGGGMGASKRMPTRWRPGS